MSSLNLPSSRVAGPWPRPLRRGPAAAALCLAMVLAGCASPPSPSRPSSQAIGAPRPAPGADGPPDAPGPDPLSVPDAEPRIEPIRSGGPNKPYEVAGQSYVPLARDEPLVETGLASWYGKKFHGRRTASGEVYNMHAMTAAHKTMPIPSFARVRNPANGREIIVRINDRGPFVAGRIIDLSYAAAMKLGTPSLARVEVSRLTHDDIRAMGQGDTRVARAEPAAEPPPAAARPVAPRAQRNRQGAANASGALPNAAGAAVASPSPAPAAAAQPSAQTQTLTLPVQPQAPSPLPPTNQAQAPGSVTTPPAPLAQEGSAPSAATRDRLAVAAEPPTATSQGVSDSAVAAAPLPAAAADKAPLWPPLALPAGAQTPGQTGPLARAYTQAAAGFWLQLGAFGRGEGALDFHQKLSHELDWLAPWLAVFVDGALHRLQAGPFASREQALESANRVRESVRLAPLLIERR